MIIISQLLYLFNLVRDVEKTLALRSPPPAGSGRNSAQQSQTLAELVVRFDCPQVPPMTSVNGALNLDLLIKLNILHH